MIKYSSKVILSLLRLFIITLIILISFSCDNDEKLKYADSSVKHFERIWYKQASIDLGVRIKMYSTEDGIAISSGRGEINGNLYDLKKGKWTPIYSFPYSDFPLLTKYDSNTVWAVNHLTHHGAYRPVLSSISNGIRKEINLPKVMWDEIDYAMFLDIQVLPDGTGWMIGQQGNILFFDGNKWLEAESPIDKKSLPNLLSGNLNSIDMIDSHNGWAVGKDGIILQYKNGKWEKTNSPTNKQLFSIKMVNENLGWIVGDRGTILKYSAGKWHSVPFETPNRLLRVLPLNENEVFIVGENSAFYQLKNGVWMTDPFLKNFDDNFSDISIIVDNKGENHIWLIGGKGIYTTSQTLEFSFTDYTAQSSLRNDGRAGMFFKKDLTSPINLFLLQEQGPSLLYELSEQKTFLENSLNAGLNNDFSNVQSIAVGDINNDGYNDLFIINDFKNYRIYLGATGEAYHDFTTESKLFFPVTEQFGIISARFIDINNDGALDLYVSSTDNQDMVFRNDGAGRFQLIPNSSTTISKPIDNKSFGNLFSDFNNDGLIDVLIPYNLPNNGKICDLYFNEGDFKFNKSDDSAFSIDASISFSTHVSIAEDFNNDGYMDFVIHHQKKEPTLFYNNKNGTFRKADSKEFIQNVAFSPEPTNGILNSADVNNDGWMDIFISSKLFINNAGNGFTEVSEAAGLNFSGNPSFVDYDDDGDLDLFIASSRHSFGQGERARFYRNNLVSDNFVKVNLISDESNRSGIGTAIFLEAFDSNGNLIHSTQKILGLGSSPLIQQNISELLFGLPSAAKYRLTTKFPSGSEIVKEFDKKGLTLIIRESSFFTHIYLISIKSLKRTLILFNTTQEVIKLLLLLIFFSLSFFISKKYFKNPLGEKFYFYFFLTSIYLVLVHVSVMERFGGALLYSILPVALICITSIILSRNYQIRKEAKYISHFKIIEEIGRGGMGIVYKAFDKVTKRTIALKVLNKELLDDIENRRRFSSEGQLLSTFNNPAIVKVFEIGESEGKGFIAMELLTGGTLKEYVKLNHPIGHEKIFHFALQICEGIKEIHAKSIIHRDLKTNNLMLDENGNIRIMDFGLSKSSLITTMSSLGTVIGTLGYCAPEQITNTIVDQRTDIFSLGVIFYELLSNEIPFKGENEIAIIHSIFNTNPKFPENCNPKLTEFFEEIICKCLEKDPSKRFANIDEVNTKLLSIN
ncbi:MAG: protein kinase [Ignavibacteria bacterium]|nr:protein kinase [Ignavibacteria bacterium]